GAPSPRTSPLAAWTGSEMLIWGGFGGSGDQGAWLADGGRYNPTTRTWAPLTTDGAPSPRFGATAVWTGTEMIIWGGRSARGIPYADGARYEPATDTWTPVASSGAPAARSFHSAVWTGQEMMVWGAPASASPGVQIVGPRSGGRYDPL